MDELNDYVSLTMDEINKAIASVPYKDILLRDMEHKFKANDREFTLRIVGSNERDEDTGYYVVVETEYDTEANRFQGQYFMATHLGKGSPLLLTEKMLLRPISGLLISHVLNLIGNHTLIDVQIRANESYREQPYNPNILYQELFKDPHYDKDLYESILNQLEKTIGEFRQLVYKVVMQYKDK